jgi:hypothetical protein
MKVNCKLCLASLIALLVTSLNALAASPWVQGSKGTVSSVASPYTDQTGPITWTWTNNGALSGSVTTTRLQATATNFNAMATVGGGSTNGSKALNESGFTRSFSYWDWTGAPSPGTSITITSVVSIAKDSGAFYGYGVLSDAYAYAPSAGTLAWTWAEAKSEAKAEYYDGTGNWTVEDDGIVSTDAYSYDAAHNPFLSEHLSSSNASLSNILQGMDTPANSEAYAATDYSLSYSHGYTTASSLSTVMGSALISFNCHAEIKTSGTPPQFGVMPGGSAIAAVSIEGSVTMDFLF